jgi:hypothetical protein
MTFRTLKYERSLIKVLKATNSLRKISNTLVTNYNYLSLHCVEYLLFFIALSFDFLLNTYLYLKRYKIYSIKGRMI